MEKGIGIGSSSQAELVPIQKQIIVAELARQNKEQQEQMPDNDGVGSGRTRNAAAGGHQSSLDESETVRYINENENS